MILSRSTEYAIRLIFYLIERQPLPRYVRIKDVAAELEVSYNQLAKVANVLITEKFLKSNTGPTGGIDLEKDATDLTLSKIVNIFGDGEIFDRCVLGLKECSDENPCPIHAVWGETRGDMKDIFFNKTMGELKAMSSLPFLPGKDQ